MPPAEAVSGNDAWRKAVNRKAALRAAAHAYRNNLFLGQEVVIGDPYTVGTEEVRIQPVFEPPYWRPSSSACDSHAQLFSTGLAHSPRHGPVADFASRGSLRV